jgi:hypothetical protein
MGHGWQRVPLGLRPGSSLVMASYGCICSRASEALFVRLTGL